ncbi:MAG TPA: hypothetical protein VK348_15085 [Planctomycetota bacterium]|nr:hypothetical protein [Planctomycetota bacterium]
MNFTSLWSVFVPLSCLLAARAAAVAPEPPAPAPPARLELELGYSDAGLAARLQSDRQSFFGAVILSLSPQQMYFLRDLPPLLASAVVLGAGPTKNGELDFLARSPVRLPVPVYGQGVLFDQALTATKVVMLPGAVADAPALASPLAK